jgi:hypothetical protein
VGAKLELARAAIQDERWADAQEAAAAALAIDPSNQAAKDLDTQARTELKNQLQHGRFTEVVRKREYDAVAEQFNKIDRESVYRVKAQGEHDRMREEYIGKVRAEADKLAGAGRCRDLPALERRARRAWAEAGEAVNEYTDQCKRVAAASPPAPAPARPEETPPKPVPPKPTPPEAPAEPAVAATPSPAAAPPSAANCPQMIKDAKVAAKASMFGKALKLCEDALDACKGDQEALTVCAISACNLKNEGKAKRYIKGLKSTDRRSMAAQICMRFGIQAE